MRKDYEAPEFELTHLCFEHLLSSNESVSRPEIKEDDEFHEL